jgi:ribosomal protein S6--L-glutamate ligase
LRIGVVGVPGSWSSECLAEAFGQRTGFRLLVDMSKVTFDSRTGQVRFGEHDLSDLDALVIKKLGAAYSPAMLDRLELLQLVASQGVPMFSRPSSILHLIDRLSCTLVLQRAGIPLPPTVVTEDVREATLAVREFGQAVLKPLYSTKARGMTLLDATEANLEKTIRTYQGQANPILYVQKKIDIPGRDLGVAFVGGEYLGTYARVAGGGAWNTTIHAGGHYAPHAPQPETVEVAQRAQALFDLDFTTVDVVETSDGPLVFEVSAFGGFRGLKDGFDIDAAAHLVQHVLRNIASRREPEARRGTGAGWHGPGLAPEVAPARSRVAPATKPARSQAAPVRGPR